MSAASPVTLLPPKSEGSGQGYRLLEAEAAFCSQGGDSKKHATLFDDRLAQSDRLLSWVWKTAWRMSTECKMHRGTWSVLRIDRTFWGAGSSEKH